ncbi:hypothetical protein IWQ60_009449 [Tieghemiomyces parasiticus]|uniref:Uncharacterized protein n=1 Tax=Tieghemiomyces parasiticus TaxID=78921 RepID=A0A9W7ZTR4_9FUNG|nr:hypothetical protein IWQ60_009449 [Tieghemiomyces parasiticus]
MSRNVFRGINYVVAQTPEDKAFSDSAKVLLKQTILAQTLYTQRELLSESILKQLADYLESGLEDDPSTTGSDPMDLDPGTATAMAVSASLPFRRGVQVGALDMSRLSEDQLLRNFPFVYHISNEHPEAIFRTMATLGHIPARMALRKDIHAISYSSSFDLNSGPMTEEGDPQGWESAGKADEASYGATFYAVVWRLYNQGHKQELHTLLHNLVGYVDGFSGSHLSQVLRNVIQLSMAIVATAGDKDMLLKLEAVQETYERGLYMVSSSWDNAPQRIKDQADTRLYNRRSEFMGCLEYYGLFRANQFLTSQWNEDYDARTFRPEIPNNVHSLSDRGLAASGCIDHLYDPRLGHLQDDGTFITAAIDSYLKKATPDEEFPFIESQLGNLMPLNLPLTEYPDSNPTSPAMQ